MGRIQNEIVSTAQQIGMSTLATPLTLEKSNSMLRKAEESRVLAASEKAQNKAVLRKAEELRALAASDKAQNKGMKRVEASDVELTDDEVQYIKADAAEPYREKLNSVADKWDRRLGITPSQAARDNAEVVKAHRNVFTGDRAKLDEIKMKMKRLKKAHDINRVRDVMFRKEGGEADDSKDDR